MIELRPDANRAVAFLLWINRGTDLHLERMESIGPARPKSRQYTGQEADAAERYIATNNGADYQRNMYFLPNAEFLSGERSKANIESVRFLHVDLDTKDYPEPTEDARERIIALLTDPRIRPKGVPVPTAFWFTGGGYQAVWRLGQALEVRAAEGLNTALLSVFRGGPGTHDASRLLRLPMSVNWLNDKKRKDGRTPALAMLLDPVDFTRPPAEYGPSEFGIKITQDTNRSATGPKAMGTACLPSDLSDLVPTPLPQDLREILPADQKWIDVILTGRNPPDKEYASRSELAYAATFWMLGQGMAPGHVLSILTQRELGISAHVLDQSSPLKYARRQVSRALTVINAGLKDWPVRNDKGHPYSDRPENIRYALSLISVDATRNMFTQSDEVTGYGLEDRDLNDIGDILSSAFSRELQFGASPASVKREIISLAHENNYHPVIDYLDELEWDGECRIDSWLARYCGAETSELNSEFGAKFLIAGVRRIRQPGIKFDTMLVLEGPQGAGKSQLAAKLAVRSEWFCGSLDLKSDDKAKAELLARAWIVECQELDGINKTTSQNLKRFLSTSTDTFRRAYSRDAASFRRHCIILGTTNDGTYLHDLTGNRRIWPVHIGAIDLRALDAEIDQLWAEAVVREKAGDEIALSMHLWPKAQEAQAKRMVEDAYRDVLEGAFADRTGRVSMDSVKLLLGLDTSKMTSHEARRVRNIMAELGWEFGTHRLFDLARRDITQRKGFARGDLEERKTEYISSREQNGTVSIRQVPGSKRDGAPF